MSTTTTAAKKTAAKPRKSAAKSTKKPAAKKTTPKGKSTTKTAAKKPRNVQVEERRGRGNLALDVLEVVEKYDKGSFKLPDGKKTLTPTAISKAIHESELKGNSKAVAPSAGAITNVIRDMSKIGFVTLHAKPVAVKQITAAGHREGYSTLKEKAKK